MKHPVYLLLILLLSGAVTAKAQQENKYCCETEPLDWLTGIYALPTANRAPALATLCYDSIVAGTAGNTAYTAFIKFCDLKNNARTDANLFSTLRFWDDGMMTYVFSQKQMWSFYLSMVKRQAALVSETENIFKDAQFIYRFTETIQQAGNEKIWQMDMQQLKPGTPSTIELRIVAKKTSAP